MLLRPTKKKKQNKLKRFQQRARVINNGMICDRYTFHMNAYKCHRQYIILTV